MTHENTQADSGGPVVEWRERRAFVGEIELGSIRRENRGAYWSWTATLIELQVSSWRQGDAETEEGARTACEAAIHAWFRALGWPDQSADRALIRQMREALAELSEADGFGDRSDLAPGEHVQIGTTQGAIRKAMAALAAAQAIEERTDG